MRWLASIAGGGNAGEGRLIKYYCDQVIKV
jgi:hypothetical protein